MTDETKLNSAGRPTVYTAALRDKICDRLSLGETLRSICRDPEMPARQTIYEWIYKNIGEKKEGQDVLERGFSDHYHEAREVGLDMVADETIEIADDATNDFMEARRKDGSAYDKFNAENVLRSKLRVDARHRYLENMAPRKYGKNVKVMQQALDKEGKPADQPAGSKDFLAACEAIIRANMKDA
jgi:hypothetical protein